MLDNILLDRITRDISDGLLVLDMQGVISFVNPSAKELLEAGSIKERENYASAMMEDFKKDNDDFFQFLLNAVYERNKTHTGEIRFITRKGNIKWFNMSTSFLFGEDGETKVGVLVRFEDITDVHLLKQKTYDSAFVFVVMMAAVSLWAFVYLIWLRLGEPISSSAMTQVVEVFGFIVFYILWKHTSITLSEMGLSAKGAKKYIVIDFIATLIASFILVAVKLILLEKNPGMFASNTLFDFGDWDWSCTLYPITAVVQEFLTRGVIHESVKRIMPGKHSAFWAILVSSLFFGALHIHKGIFFMMGAFALLSVFGIIYEKQKTIWGLCIPHFVLGMLFIIMF